MSEGLEKIEQQLPAGRNFDSPPLHLWQPELSGDIDIRIDNDGQWYHEGDPILRDRIVKLFAAILRREQDGEYYLVTPAEKWRIQVARHALMVTDFVVAGSGLILTLNTGKQVDIASPDDWYLDPQVGNIAAVTLPHGLSALFTRAAWYRLVEQAEVAAEGGLNIAGLKLA